MNKLGPFDIKFSKEFRKEFYQSCEQIFDEGYLTNHHFVTKFEKEFSKFSKAPFSLMTSSGTSALEIALRTIGVRGKKVIIPSCTFIATALAVINAGGEPVILDIEDEYFSLAPKGLKENINADVAAVITVHIGGHISPRILDIVDICKEAGLPLVEDCAHAHGASFQGKTAGTFGLVGCFSHFLTKVMTTGEGGSIVFNNQKDYEKAKSIRQFGMDPENPLLHIQEGINSKVTEFQGALGLIELKRITSRIEKRRVLAGRYSQNLKSSRWKVIADNDEMNSSYYKQIVVPLFKINRSDIVSALAEENINLTGGVYYYPLHNQPSLKKFVGKGMDFSIVDEFAKNHICPPCYPELTEKDIDRTCNVLLKLSNEK